MSFANTLNRFRLLSGLDDAEITRWSPVLRESMEYVRTLVNTDEFTDEQERRADSAAGVYAYYRYVCCTIDDERSFRAGELNVTLNSEKSQLAEKMWESELKALRDSLVDAPFVFRRI